ncbi:MAG: hypothetical protein ACFBZ8_13305 [Opitutales bacterium]
MLATLSLSKVSAEVIVLPSDLDYGLYVRDGDTMIINEGTTHNEWVNAQDATIIMNGGYVADIGGWGDSTVTINGGTVGWGGAGASDGSTLNVNGGIFTSFIIGRSGSTVNFNGGEVNWALMAYGGSTFNISGGGFSVDNHRSLFTSSTSHINFYAAEALADVQVGAFAAGESLLGQTFQASDFPLLPLRDSGFYQSVGAALTITFGDGNSEVFNLEEAPPTVGLWPSEPRWEGTISFIQVPEPAAYTSILGVCMLLLAVVRHRRHRR